MKRLIVLALIAGCPEPAKKGPAPLADLVLTGDRDTRSDLVAELQDDILKSYERDEPPDFDNAMVPKDVGVARIGVGPGDVLVNNELARAPSRWPLDIDQASPADARSKRLAIHLSADRTAAWATDEISWRIKMCERTAVIPLRMTALFARDGDRWVPVFEHLSFARTAIATRPGQKLPRELRTAVASRDLADELSRVLSPVLRRALDKSPKALAQGPELALLGPDVAAEWHGLDAIGARLMPGSEPMKLEDRRVGVVGRTFGNATIGYWVGNLTADLPARPGISAGKGHFRATFVFERRRGNDPKDNEWVIVQGHVSHAIEDDNLASAIFGTALISPKPLAITCDDGSRPQMPKKASN
ncbi:MAG: hypothetical protein H0V17_28220 [Deltaproteobacteria bacterium]|nr:hypothetical protein [Deltaproteobacteria bacterium]